MRLLDHIVDTATALHDRSYAPSRSSCFVVQRPKAREIHAALFADRVVHHVLEPRLEAIYEPIFIHDLYSNRKGKGTHRAVARLSGFMRSLEGMGQGMVYALQLDVRNFFNTIDRRILWGMIKGRLAKAVRRQTIGQEEGDALGWLTWRLLSRHPAAEVIAHGRKSEFERVPPYKRLAAAPPGKGLPIGNLTSQFFANVYLNELDQFVKHQLRCRHYLRYVDDFVLLHHDRDQLMIWHKAIADFLRERLDLELKDKGRLCPVGDGIDFLGYIVRPHYCLVRRRVVGNLREKLDALFRRMVYVDEKRATLTVRLTVPDREALLATLASYFGHFRHANAYRLTHSLWQRYPWLRKIVTMAPSGRLRPLWQPTMVTSLRSQWRWFREQAPGEVVLMQVGKRMEAFGSDAEALVAVAGVRLDPVTRPGFTVTAGVIMSRLVEVCRRLRRAKMAYQLVVEDGYLRGGMRRRVVREWWIPTTTIIHCSHA